MRHRLDMDRLWASVAAARRVSSLRSLWTAAVVIGAVLWFPANAYADCAGSATNWFCSAGSTAVQVQSAIDSADDEATITFASGSYDWTGDRLNLNNIDGVTLICELAGSCEITHVSDVIYKDFVPTSSNKLHRISGFHFVGSSGTGTIWFYAENDLTAIRIDHNTFTETSETGCHAALFFGALSAGYDGNMYGVIDHNTFTSSSSRNHQGVTNLSGQDAAWQVGLPGSANNLVIEDNTFTYSATNYDGGCGCIDAWNGGPTVFRYNTTTNCRAVTHGVCHGGPPNVEIYRNTLSTPDGFRNIHHQGSGEMFVFDNDLTNGGDIALLHYRSCPSADTGCGLPRCDGTQPIDGNRSPIDVHYGYPCYQQPGRNVEGTLRPIFAWRNVNNGGVSAIDYADAWGCSNPSPFDHVKPDRDYYNAVSGSAQTSPSFPFDGTTGMGFGTLANRPTTCTTTAEAGDAGNGGVGYWATDVGNWNLLAGIGDEQGTLYMCTAPNTWTEYYEPYVYPHPLVGPTLKVTGSCPGEMSITVARATGNATIALLGSASEGSSSVPDGQPCGGLSLNLEAPRLLATFTTGPAGNQTNERVLSPESCGMYLQAVDLDRCETTNVGKVPLE